MVSVVLLGCSQASTGAPRQVAPTGTTAPRAAAPLPSCPPAGPPAPVWPAAVPAALTKPPGSQILSTRIIGSATYVSFTTPTSLRASTLYLVRTLTGAGYTLARGDAEATEADAPFVSPAVVGAIRLTLTATCLTTWILAIEPRIATVNPAPTLIPYHPGPSAQPLPFG